MRVRVFLFKKRDSIAKRKRNIDINKRLKEGRGSGRVKDYKPWLPSLGRATRLKGIKTQRQYELLLGQERNYFYILDFLNIVEDIPEQYPLLPIEETILIANELGIEHSKNPETGEYNVMTTDFFYNCEE